MTITEILELDDKYPVPSVDRALISKIVDVGDSSQLITLKEEKKTLRLVLKCKDHFLEAEGNYVGKYLKVMSGKPVGNKPTGITTKIIDGKMKLLISEKATLSITDDLMGKTLEPQLTEQKLSYPEDCELSPESSFAEGPSDDFIISNIHARIHLSNLLDQVELEDPTKLAFISDRQSFITSLYMDCVNTGHKILPVPQKEKKRFEKYDKPAANMPAKETKLAKDPVAMTIEDAIKACPITKSLKAAKSKQGVPVYDLLLQPLDRAKSYRWYWMMRTEDCGSLEPLREALKNFYNLLPVALKKEVIIEAVRMDVSILCKVAYDDEDALNTCLAEILKTMKAKDFGSAFAIEFFGKDKEDRTIEFS